jgi:WD40 repeat protein
MVADAHHAHGSDATSAAFTTTESPRLGRPGRDGPARVRLWDLDALIWPQGPAYLPDSRSFLTINLPSGEVARWDAATLRPTEALSFLRTGSSGLDLTKDGRWLALGKTNDSIEVWDLPA